MKIALFADQSVGLSIATHLVERFRQDIAFIVTVCENKISSLARQHAVPNLLCDDLDDISNRLQQGVDLGILAWWPKIIKRQLLDSTRLGFINTHPSLLPFNRGKHYNFWAIVEEVPFGVTLHAVDQGTDTGPIIAQQSIDYDWTDTGETLYKKAQQEIVKLFVSKYPELRSTGVNSIPQNLNDGSYHHSSELETASQILLDKAYPARQLLNLLRARTFDGHPGAWFEADGERFEISVKIRKVKK